MSRPCQRGSPCRGPVHQNSDLSGDAAARRPGPASRSSNPPSHGCTDAAGAEIGGRASTALLICSITISCSYRLAPSISAATISTDHRSSITARMSRSGDSTSVAGLRQRRLRWRVPADPGSSRRCRGSTRCKASGCPHSVRTPASGRNACVADRVHQAGGQSVSGRERCPSADPRTRLASTLPCRLLPQAASAGIPAVRRPAPCMLLGQQADPHQIGQAQAQGLARRRHLVLENLELPRAHECCTQDHVAPGVGDQVDRMRQVAGAQAPGPDSRCRRTGSGWGRRAGSSHCIDCAKRCRHAGCGTVIPGRCG